MIEHIPVLPGETIQYLAPQKDENFIDATCGLGGHSKLILQKNGPKGRLLAIDQDGVALEETKKNLKNYRERTDFLKSNFNNLGLIKRLWPVSHIDGILFDLGVSTYQLKTLKRGFSFQTDANLDMRMAPDTQRISAYDIVNTWSKRELNRILKIYGEEPWAGKIAAAFVKARSQKPITRTNELVEIIKRVLPPKYRAKSRKHFATATFRALRMTVNSELENLESGLKQALQVISPGGRLVVISFHSLEDRLVKNFFRNSENLEILTPKPIVPSQKEIIKNPAASSAKLRAGRKL